VHLFMHSFQDAYEAIPRPIGEVPLPSSLLVSNENIKLSLDGLDADAVPVAVTLFAHKATDDLLNSEIFALKLDITKDTPRVNCALEI